MYKKQNFFLMSGKTHNYKGPTWRKDFGDDSFFWVSHNTYTETPPKKPSHFGKKHMPNA